MDRDRIVAGLDVCKDSIFLCIMPHGEAIIFEKTYGTLTTRLRLMRDDMLRHGVTECAMESTAVYQVQVCIKQLPEHKSDIKDAQWIAECQLKRFSGRFSINKVKNSPNQVLRELGGTNNKRMARQKEWQMDSGISRFFTYILPECYFHPCFPLALVQIRCRTMAF